MDAVVVGKKDSHGGSFRTGTAWKRGAFSGKTTRATLRPARSPQGPGRLLRQRPELRPAIPAPKHRRKLKLRCAGRIAVVIMIGQPIALGGFHRLLSARADEAAFCGQHQRAPALQHRFAIFVSVWTFDPVGAADADVVGRGDALAALVEADEEVELGVML